MFENKDISKPSGVPECDNEGISLNELVLVGTDLDSNADLKIEIDWGESNAR